MISRILFALTLFLSTFSLSAQNADLSTMTVDLSDEIAAENNWTFFANEDNHSMYIDFETIGGYATDLSIVDESGETVLTEKLTDLPKNSIFELSLNDLPKGNYSLKIRTYQDVVVHDVSVK